MSLKIYRRLQSQPETANTLIATLPGTDTEFLDNNANAGLTPASPYVYTFQREVAGKVYDPVTLTSSTLAASTVIKVSFDGHSLLTRFGATGVESVPELLRANFTEPTWMGFISYAVAGQTAVQMLSDAVTQVDAAFDSAVSKHLLVIWPAINDLAAVGANLESIKNTVQSYIQGRITAGYKLIVLTETSARGSSYAARHASIDAMRLEYNQWLRDNWQSWGVTYLIDLASDYRIGDYEDGLNTAFFVDGIHMNLAGRTIVADMTGQALAGAAVGNTGVITGQTAPVSNQPPVVSAGPTQNLPVGTKSTTLSGTASDADGTIASVFWERVSGPSTGNIATPAALSTTVSGLFNGVYSFKLTATDNSGASTSSTVTVAVGEVDYVAPEGAGHTLIDHASPLWVATGGTWTTQTNSLYIGGSGKITTAIGAIRTIRVIARYAELYAPYLKSAGRIEFRMVRMTDDVVIDTKIFDHAALGIDQKEGYPNDNTPALVLDGGVFDAYRIEIKNLGGGNNAIGYGQARIRKV